jgi:hypothetical protein
MIALDQALPHPLRPNAAMGLIWISAGKGRLI